jgi:hypothetical protein
LTADEKKKRLEIATLLKQRFNAELSLLTKRALETLNRRFLAVERVEKSNLPATQKISTSAIKGQANDLC